MISFPDRLVSQRIRLRFFDRQALLVSDAPSFISLLRSMYARFVVPSDVEGSGPTNDFALLTGSGNSWGAPVLISDGRARTLDDPATLEGLAYDAILQIVLEQVTSHVLVHGAALSRDGRGLILVGDGGDGKTTLALELIRRGFRFLSDEIAALGRDDGLLHPFPRSLRLRPGTLELAGFPEAAAGAPEWMGKLLLDIDAICPGALGEPTQASRVVVLGREQRDDGRADTAAPAEVTLCLSRMDQDLPTLAARLDGVVAAEGDRTGPYPFLRLRALRPMSTLMALERLCDERNIWVLNVVRKQGPPPDFGGPARLVALARSQGALELVRHYYGGHHARLVAGDCGASPAMLLVEIARLMGRTEFYRLTPGPLGEMADLVCEMMG